ncbi:MAG TPA: glycosyltransferase family 2 protein [Gammaproteobacteria bacterium]|nr:glycosyltransferase family 2 protein [Gammaproteobacteria bacterium]
MQTKIAAIIVTFHPDAHKLSRLISNLANQVQHIVIVDNTPLRDVEAAAVLNDVKHRFDVLAIERLGENRGVATAFNVGIELSLDAGCTHVLLSDQDSVPCKNMVSGLIKTLAGLQASGAKVGAVGPVFKNTVALRAFKFQTWKIRHLLYQHRELRENEDFLEAIALISSGCLIPAQVIEDVGMMLDELFIDFVDIEWCFRASSAGYGVYASNHSQMVHEMGDSLMRIWLFRWIKNSEYSPIRLYYQFRNSAYLVKLKHVPLVYKIGLVHFWIAKVYAYALFSPRKTTSLRMMFHGLRDGFTGKLGPFIGRTSSQQ